MLIKNEIYETVITDYTSEGQGVARVEGCAVFVPNAIAGERISLRIDSGHHTCSGNCSRSIALRLTIGCELLCIRLAEIPFRRKVLCPRRN